jgi:hypothetical protein
MAVLSGVGLVRTRGHTDETATVDVDYHSVVKTFFLLVQKILEV